MEQEQKEYDIPGDGGMGKLILRSGPDWVTAIVRRPYSGIITPTIISYFEVAPRRTNARTGFPWESHDRGLGIHRRITQGCPSVVGSLLNLVGSRFVIETIPPDISRGDATPAEKAEVMFKTDSSSKTEIVSIALTAPPSESLDPADYTSAQIADHVVGRAGSLVFAALYYFNTLLLEPYPPNLFTEPDLGGFYAKQTGIQPAD